MDNKELNLFPIDYPFETLISRVSSNKLILDPDFQRKYKWDRENNEKGSKFIESCLMRIPLPACYFAENSDKNHVIIDGLQRITTIKRFFKDEFALEGLTIFKELNGKKFSEIGSYKGELETYTIRCIVLRNDNDKEIIQEIFARLNQGSVSLTPQEIRHAVYSGKFDKLLTELAQNDIIQNFGLGRKSRQVKDGLDTEEQVLRFFAMRGDLSDYQGNFSKYLDSFMHKNQNASDEDIEEMRKLFNDTLNKCFLVFGDDVFSDLTKERPRQRMAYYDLLMWSFQDLDLEFLSENKDKIKEAFGQLCTLNEFQKTNSGGLQKKSSIIKRRRLWNQKLSDING